jgi:hypothetical protein
MNALFLAVTALAAAGGSKPPTAAPEIRSERVVLEQTTAVVALRAPWLSTGAEEVLLDGSPLRFGADYLLEPGSGLLRLNRAAPRGAIIELRRPVSLLEQPLSDPAAGRSDAGLARDARQLAARRWGLALDRRAGLAAVPLVAGVSGVGTALPRAAPTPLSATALADQLRSGVRSTTFNDDRAAPGGSQGRVTYQRVDPLDPRTAAQAREEFSTNLNLRPSASSVLRLNQSFARESLFTAEYREEERRHLEFEQRFGKSTANLMWDRRRTEGASLLTQRDSVALGVSHLFGRSTSAQGLFSYDDSQLLGREARGQLTLRQRLGAAWDAQAHLQQRASELSGTAFEGGVQLAGRPGRASDVTVALQQSNSERYGQFRRVSAEANTALSRQAQLSGEFFHRSSDRQGEVLGYTLGLAVRPTLRTLLEASLDETQGREVGRESVRTLRFNADPSAGLKIQLGLDMLGRDEGGGYGTGSRNALWIVTAGGHRYVKLDGYSGLNFTLSPDGTARSYGDTLHRVEVRPHDRVSVSGSLRRIAGDGGERSLLGVGAAVKPLPGVDVSASLRQPTLPPLAASTPSNPANNPGAPVGRELQVRLAPLAGLKLFGKYDLRPEDRRGGLLDELHRTVGLETRLGSLSLLGSVTRMDRYAAPIPTERKDILATLNLGRTTRLFGGLEMREPTALDSPRFHIYRLGLSQSFSPSFFMMLEGQVGWAIDSRGVATPYRDETRGQARLGVRF